MHELEIEGLDAPLPVARFSGAEAISELFHFEVAVVTDDALLDLASLIGKRAELRIGGGDAPRSVVGIVRRAHQGAVGGLAAAYQITLVPNEFRLALRRDQRIFQELSSTDIIAQVLDGAGLSAAKLRLQKPARKREYCVQYDETDLDFVARLLEDEGIASWVEASDGEATLVFCDSPAGSSDVIGNAEIAFRPPAGALVSGDHIASLSFGEELRSGRATLRDYRFQAPSLDVSGTEAASKNAELELYSYPAHEMSAGDARDKAKTRLAQEETLRRTVRGTSNCRRLVPGVKFKLIDHPRNDFNIEMLVTRVVSRGHDAQLFAGAEGTPYEAEFEAIPADTPFRPARVTPQPRVFGMQTAVVVGPAGQEIYVDELGRIKVQFHWDRLGKKDEHTTCFMRVAQPWAGQGFGAMFLPRVGHEVLVSFLEGNPDRPVVTGSVYNGANVVPYSLPEDKTRTTLKTRSSPGGDGFNELRFEDAKGREEVFMRAEKDMNVLVQHDRDEHVGNDETVAVDGYRTTTIGKDDKTTVGMNRMVDIGKNHTEVVGANLTVTVGQNVAFSGVGGSFQFTGAVNGEVQEATKLHFADEKEEAIDKASRTKVGGDSTLSVSGNHTVSVDKDASLAVTGSLEHNVEKDVTTIAGESYVVECGDAKVTIKKNGDIEITGKKLKIVADGAIAIEGQKLTVKSDGAVDVKASGAIKLKGSTVDMN